MDTPFQKFLDEFSDGLSVNSCDIGWSRKGIGFGSFHFYYDKNDKKLKCSSESMSPRFVREILMAMVDEAVFVDMFGGMLTGKELTVEKCKELREAEVVRDWYAEPYEMLSPYDIMTKKKPCRFCGVGPNEPCRTVDMHDSTLFVEMGDMVHTCRIKD